MKNWFVWYNEAYPKYVSYHEVAEATGVEKEKVVDMLYHYRNYGYIGRRKGRCPLTDRLLWKYRIKMLGIETLLKLDALHQQGSSYNTTNLHT